MDTRPGFFALQQRAPTSRQGPLSVSVLIVLPTGSIKNNISRSEREHPLQHPISMLWISRVNADGDGEYRGSADAYGAATDAYANGHAARNLLRSHAHADDERRERVGGNG